MHTALMQRLMQRVITGLALFATTVAFTHNACAADEPAEASPAAKPANAAPPAARADDEEVLLADLPAPLRQRLRQMDQDLAKVKDIEARFMKRKYTPLLRKPLVSQGRVRAREGLVRWDTLEPRPSFTIISATEIRILYPDQKRLEIFPLDPRFAEFSANLLPRMMQMAQRFEIERIAPEDLADEPAPEKTGASAEKTGENGGGAVAPAPAGNDPVAPDAATQAGGHDADDEAPRYLALRLTPRDPALRKNLTSLAMLVDVQAGFLRKLRIEQPQGEKTVYTFEQVKLNPGLKDSDFELELPRGTQVVRPFGEADANDKNRP